MLEKDNRVNNFKTIMGNNFSSYAKWLNEISWIKFIAFVIFVLIGQSMLEDSLNIYNCVLDDLTSFFIFVSLGIKIFSNKRCYNKEIKE